MIQFKKFIIEGGNVKVKTSEGEVSAAPFKVKNRYKNLNINISEKFKDEIFI